MKTRGLSAITCSCFAAMLLFSSRALAQGDGNLSPQRITVYDSMDAQPLIFDADFSAFSSVSSVPVFFNCSQGVTCKPSAITVPQNFYGMDFSLQITVYPDKIGPCPVTGIEACVDSAGGRITSALIVYGYIYNSQLKGHVHTGKDTLNFGKVMLGSNDSLLLPIDLDTCGSIFRYLWPRGVQAPFSAPDSIVPDPCRCSWIIQSFYAHFRPMGIKVYTDPVFIYDPIQHDSIPLILLGEGTAAGVSGNPVIVNLRIFPNPADHEANISLTNGALGMVTIYNIMGNAVMQIPASGQNYLTLNTSALPSGLYYLEAASRERVYRERLMVSH